MAAAAITPTLIDKGFHNWVKGAIAIRLAREGLLDFVHGEICHYHASLLRSVQNANASHRCTYARNRLPNCNNSKINGVWQCKNHVIGSIPTRHQASCGVCCALMAEICLNHRYRGPSWNNTDATQWCTDAFHVAKCYMPPDGYRDKIALSETDFNGILSVMINSKSFQKKMTAKLGNKPNICTKVGYLSTYRKLSICHSLINLEVAFNKILYLVT